MLFRSDAERQQLDVDENTFAIYRQLKPDVPQLSVENATTLNTLFTRFPDFQWNEQEKGRLRTELYKTLRPLVPPAKLITTANALLRLHRV